jgi:hypothetical protein
MSMAICMPLSVSIRSMASIASIASWQWACVAAVATEADAAGIECRAISSAIASPSQPRMGSRAIMRASSRVRMGPDDKRGC